jgi:hypothetical protein
MLSDTTPAGADAQHTTNNDVWKAAAKVVAAKGIVAVFVDWPTQGSVTGCDSHPNALTHAGEAGVLAEAIRETLGW